MYYKLFTMTGIELKKILRIHGLTASEVARSLGMSRQNFATKLTSQDLKIGFLERVAAVTDIPLSDMITPPTEPSSGDILNPQHLAELVKSLTETVRLQQETIAHLVGVKAVLSPPPPRKMKHSKRLAS